MGVRYHDGYDVYRIVEGRPVLINYPPYNENDADWGFGMTDYPEFDFKKKTITCPYPEGEMKYEGCIIFGISKKRRGCSKYLLSVDVMVGKDQKIPARIVCVRNKKNKKDWIAFICTDISLTEEEIIRIYGKRWQIEVFFKTCKSYLQLVSECHSLSYDALTAHVAIVFVRYMMIALEQRRNEDLRSLGEIFFFFTDELADITFAESLQIILKAMFESIYTIFQMTEEQMDAFIELFISRLPEYIQRALARTSAETI
jgi:hypothetical protein